MRNPKHGRRCRRLAKRLGRRGAALLIFGILYFLSGVPLLIQPAHVELHIYELRIWALLFIASGILAGISAFRVGIHDRAGYIGLMVIGFLWIAYCILSSILHLLKPVIFPSLVGQIITVSMMMVLIGVCSGWPEPAEPIGLAADPDPDRDDDHAD